MTTAQFFDLFLEELKNLPELSHYYKFHSSPKDFEFRKNYFMQRLDYVYKQVLQHETQLGHKPVIWDLGCGYGTTCLFLAMNGYKTFGSTLEFYYKFLDDRRNYWSQYGDSTLFEADYQDVFEHLPAANTYDVVILQDTLHHLEPIEQAIQIINKSIKKDAVLICVEENGNNIIQNAKLYKQRGNNRVITFWDEKLQKNITMGNENIRGIMAWDSLFKQEGLGIVPTETSFIRVLPPVFYKNKKAADMALKEKNMGNAFLHKYFYFGINFIVKRK